MNVQLVWATPNAEEMITRMARVSAPKNQDNMETAPRLLRYLIKNKHWSPYEMANMCVEIETTRAISPQILRHRSFSFQEFSQRYADTSELGSAVIPHLRRQDQKNRQNSIDDLSADVVAAYYRRISELYEDAEHLYREMVSSGVAKECARAVLPIATKTKMYMNGTLRSWIHYLQLRCDVSTQLEHRQIAEEIKQIFCEQFPIIGEAVFE
jgi:thymidylate synthase (FAD)